MTADERAQLLEDIRTSNRRRGEILERARASEDFDIPAAWQEVEDLDTSIANRIKRARQR
jgi:hypothetical protein